MTMWLSDNFHILNINCNLGLIIHEGRDVFLFDDIYMFLSKTEILVFF